MQSRRDQVQAYFFVVGRLVSAVVHGKPDALAQPNRRMNTGLFLGAIVGAVIILAIWHLVAGRRADATGP